MTEAQIAVTLSDTEFSLNELEEFIKAARSVDGIPQNALVSITHTLASMPTYVLTASTEYRSKV